MTVATGHLDDATLTKAAPATTLDPARPLAIRGALGRAALAVGDLLTALAIVLCIPFVIVAIGTPIALCLRLLLWIGRLL